MHLILNDALRFVFEAECTANKIKPAYANLTIRASLRSKSIIYETILPLDETHYAEIKIHIGASIVSIWMNKKTFYKTNNLRCTTSHNSHRYKDSRNVNCVFIGAIANALEYYTNSY